MAVYKKKVVTKKKPAPLPKEGPADMRMDKMMPMPMKKKKGKK